MDYKDNFTQRRKEQKNRRRKGVAWLSMLRGIFLVACLWNVVFLNTQPLQAQVRRGMTPADVLRVVSVGDAQISPDGEWVVYTVSVVEREATSTTLWLARTARRTPAATHTAAPLLSGDWRASNPRWSPDSKRIAFQSTRDKQTGIYVASLAERQPRFVALVREANFYIPYAGESYAWSPDSRRIAFISASEDESETGGAALNAATRNEKPNDPRVIDRIQYKTRTSFSDHARTHVWLTDVDAPADRNQPRQLTAGAFYDHALAWNPQGNEIAFLSNREPDPEANNNSDIFAVDLQGRVRQITDTRGCEYEPAWSPDGKLLAYTATTRDITTIDSIAEDTHVWVIDAEGGKGRELTAAQDRRARSPRWSPNSRAIFFLAGNQGRTYIYTVTLEGTREPRPVIQPAPVVRFADTLVAPPPRPFQISSFSISSALLADINAGTNRPTPTLAFTLSDAISPAEVWIASSTGLPVRRVSTHNDAFALSSAFSEPEELRFKSFDGTIVQGWLMKPIGFREGQRYPLILSIHGGPHGMYGYSFNPAFQIYAARGYAVLYLNPRGSSGYGQKFSDGTLREWGGGDYRDLMLGVDEALRTRAWIDPEKLGVTGGSYGGFMTNWIITQTTRFKAAVASASVSNLVSFYATSLYQDLIHAEFGGFPWDDYDLLWRWSPLRYVRAAQTPTLFIHGEQDNDVHITQAEEMYMALRRRGIETVFVRYPREGHGLREARHRVDAIERTLAWFDRYLK
jgi:dipeptidyl aminopeptidase/acylaminoacyl peptidase